MTEWCKIHTNEYSKCFSQHIPPGKNQKMISDSWINEWVKKKKNQLFTTFLMDHSLIHRHEHIDAKSNIALIYYYCVLGRQIVPKRYPCQIPRTCECYLLC